MLAEFGLPAGMKQALNDLFNPVVYTVGVWLLFGAAIVLYRKWTKPKVALTILGLVVFLFVLSVPDPNFRLIVTKPDNVPIVALIFVLGFFMWLSLRQAAINDERIEKGLPPREKEEGEDRILVWPDLIYSEFICAVLATVVLILWSVAVAAPLEEPSNPARTPNPSKAPWYFLGLQEMLVYFDPWLAGVVLPSMIISGLIAVPFCDKNPKGVGYYTLKERPFAVTTFLFGFVVLWVSLIVMGTFLRGPNWNFFGPYEVWTPHKVEALTNVNLSEFFWIKGMGKAIPENALVREAPGLLLLAGYFTVTPLVLAVTVFKKMFNQMGFIRYSIMIIHLLTMGLMIIKMILRWSFNLKYIVFIPEQFFNI